MSIINDLLNVAPEHWLMFWVILFLLLFSIPTVHEQLKKFFDVVGLTSTRIAKENEYEMRVNKIENDVIELRNDVKELNDNIKKLTEMLSGHIEQDNENNVAILRNNLWGIYRESKAQGFITNEGLKTFLELGKVYEKCGGNDIYHEKLYPEVVSLEVQ